MAQGLVGSTAPTIPFLSEQSVTIKKKIKTTKNQTTKKTQKKNQIQMNQQTKRIPNFIRSKSLLGTLLSFNSLYECKV